MSRVVPPHSSGGSRLGTERSIIWSRTRKAVTVIGNFLSGYVSACGSDGKEAACSVGDPGSIPGLGRSPGEGNGNPLQYPCLENSMG